MKLLDFSILNGWPASSSTWKFMQEQLLQLQMLSLLGGTNYIVSGCTNVGGTISNGWVVVNGEMLPFVGGAVQANVIIVDTVVNRGFSDTSSNPYYHNRVATFGVDGSAPLWSSFERNDPASGVLKRLRLAEALLDTLTTGLAAKANSSDVLKKGGTTAFTPTLATDPVNKQYVDNALWVLAKGTTHANVASTPGDLTGYSTQTIAIGSTLASSNYKVFLTVYNANNTDGRATWFIKDKTTTSFTIAIAEAAGGSTQDIYFDWMIISN